MDVAGPVDPRGRVALAAKDATDHRDGLTLGGVLADLADFREPPRWDAKAADQVAGSPERDGSTLP